MSRSILCSVVISTSPGRESHLWSCLRALSQQTYTDIEVIVSDDGSSGCAAVVAESKCRFEIKYDWRINDGNLSLSRNRGANQAKGEVLLFLNADILLNPRAIAHYMATLERLPKSICWGYVGCRKTSLAPSVWFADLEVNWLDFRFFPYAPGKFYLDPALFYAPHTLAGGHHFALRRDAFFSIGPLNEDFKLWGEEDVEYALRGLIQHRPMVFLGDAWAEHLCHAYKEAFHLKSISELAYKTERICWLEAELSTQKIPLNERVAIVFDREHEILFRRIQTHYLLADPHAFDEFRLSD